MTATETRLAVRIQELERTLDSLAVDAVRYSQDVLDYLAPDRREPNLHGARRRALQTIDKARAARAVMGS